MLPFDSSSQNIEILEILDNFCRQLGVFVPGIVDMQLALSTLFVISGVSCLTTRLRCVAVATLTDSAQRFSLHQQHRAAGLRPIHLYTARRCTAAEEDCCTERSYRSVVLLLVNIHY